jgi:hypothetical protein
VDWNDLQRWKTINEALSLGHADPPETYSTSEHLFSSLGIPAGTSGNLPRAQRGAAGLEAEEIEDLGETGRTRSGPQRGTSRGGRGRSRRGGQPDGGRPADDTRTGGERSRVRRRTRGGVPVAGEEAKPDHGPAAPRRRRKRSRGHGQPGTGAPEAGAGS